MTTNPDTPLIVVYESINDFITDVLAHFPLAEVGEDNDGQLVIYTGLREASQEQVPTLPAGETIVVVMEDQ